MWQGRALCAETDPEAFFPEMGGSTRAAKAVCRACEVRAECLEYAVGYEATHGQPGGPQGIWGGLSPEERKPLIRERRLGRAA